MGEDEHEFGLVMPFVVCASQGGPYDDEPFVAGYECGLVDAMLTAGASTVDRMVRSASVPLFDLLAMRHGYAMKAEPWPDAPDEWTRVVFRPAQNLAHNASAPGLRS